MLYKRYIIFLRYTRQHLFHSYIIYTCKHTFYIAFIHNFNIYSNPFTVQEHPLFSITLEDISGSPEE